MTRQFAPGDRLLIEAVATDVTAARLSRGAYAWLRVGAGDVVAAATSAAEVRATLIEMILNYIDDRNGDIRGLVDAILAHPILGPRLLGQQGGGAGEAVAPTTVSDFRAALKSAKETLAFLNALPPNTGPSPVQAGFAAPADTARLAAVQAERDQAVAALRELEWSEDYFHPKTNERIGACPTCGSRQHLGHERGCTLATALASSTSVGAGEADTAAPGPVGDEQEGQSDGT